jgi:DNA-binding transcriptional ArsR family regulator
MWVAKYTFDASKALIGGLAVKHKIPLHLYPFSIHERDGEMRISFFILLRDNHSPGFIRELRKHHRIIFCNHKGNFLIGQAKEPAKYNIIYDPEIIHLKPWFVDGENSVETFIVGSRKRKYLKHIAKVIEDKHLGKMNSVEWRDISKFFILDVMPKITEKQRMAIELAIKHGYYELPKKTNLRFLAKIMGVSYPTFQHHLRKAEKKMLPTLYEEYG